MFTHELLNFILLYVAMMLTFTLFLLIGLKICLLRLRPSSIHKKEKLKEIRTVKKLAFKKIRIFIKQSRIQKNGFNPFARGPAFDTWKDYLDSQDLTMINNCPYCEYFNNVCEHCPLDQENDSGLCSEFSNNPYDRKILRKIRKKTYLWYWKERKDFLKSLKNK